MPVSVTTAEQIRTLAKMMREHQPITVLTGAGLSAGSGLPVYRDCKGKWIHKEPVQGPKFRASKAIRQRYWCRSYFGWQAFSKARPNCAHNNLVALEQGGLIAHTITQNVDGLHQRAGSKSTIALHGNLSEVICLSCAHVSRRSDLQTRLKDINPDFLKIEFAVAPDGDAIVDDQHIQSFNIASCSICQGVLQPDVIFYGDNVPKQRVETCIENVLSSSMLLCIGTSLMVYSGYRFCRTANKANIPIVMINNGVTRADDIASLKINYDCAAALAQLKTMLL